MNILALDSSGIAASAAIVTEEKVLGEFFINHKMTHSQTLMPLTEQLFKTLDINKKDIDYVAVSCGPGSFTGLRIGMAAAKGLCLALGKKLIAVPTLDVIAENAAESDKLVVPVMDARRGQVYYCIYEKEKGCLVPKTDYDADSIEAVINKVKAEGKPVVFLGDGTVPFESEILKAGFEIGDNTKRLQRAACVGTSAVKAVKENKAVEPENAELIYLRKSQAERELEERENALSFRLMTKADIDIIADIEKRCFSVPWSRKMIEDDFKNGLTYYIICEKKGKPIGYAEMWHVVNEGHITNVAVVPEEQGKGTGKRLMEELIQLAKQKHMIGMTLEVRVSNEIAKHLYESFGFKAEDIRPEYYSDNRESALIMWKNL